MSEAGRAWQGSVGCVMSRHWLAGCGRQGRVWSRMARRVAVRYVRSRFGVSRHDRLGMARFGRVRFGSVRQGAAGAS